MVSSIQLYYIASHALLATLAAGVPNQLSSNA
jgi:hypothetical protein